MALRRILFTAHDGGSLLVGQFQQTLNTFEEPLAFHDLRIIDLVQVVCAFGG